MSADASDGAGPAPSARALASELLRDLRAVLFLDVVESVRIMEQHEDAFVRCWLGFLDHLRGTLLPAYRGRIVKSHGDGCLLVFETVVDAVRAALQLQQAVRAFDTQLPAAAAIRLRIGIHLADVVVSDLDLYGAGVNLAARLAALAEPGCIVVSAAARDSLVDGMGLQLADRGEHRLRHVSQPVRVWQVVGTPATDAALPAVAPIDMRPGIAVLPLRQLGDREAMPGLGHAIADDLTRALSRCPLWRVISPLSMARCRSYDAGAELAQVLGVPYLVSGSCLGADGRVDLHLELCDARAGEVLWAERYRLRLDDFLAGQDRPLHETVQELGWRVLNTELRRSGRLPFSQLEDYTLHLSAIALMHRLSTPELDRAGQLIDVLHERHRRSPEPDALRTRWHALRMVQGRAERPEDEGQQALSHAQRALQSDPTHPFALPMAALLGAQMGGPLLPALGQAQRALDFNPQEPMAGLAYAMLRGYLGDAGDFEHYSERSAELTPLDPALYVYLSLLASARLAVGKTEAAVDAATRALRANATYAPAHLMMTAAQAMAGNLDAAQVSAGHLLSLEPQFSVSRWLAEFNGRRTPDAPLRAEALRRAGLPP